MQETTRNKHTGTYLNVYSSGLVHHCDDAGGDDTGSDDEDNEGRGNLAQERGRERRGCIMSKYLCRLVWNCHIQVQVCIIEREQDTKRRGGECGVQRVVN